MLVLSRKIGERILIGDQIVVTVVKLDGSQVRLGIEAPQEIAIFREEIGPLVSRTAPPSGPTGRLRNTPPESEACHRSGRGAAAMPRVRTPAIASG